jgi:hypothetical protein
MFSNLGVFGFGHCRQQCFSDSASRRAGDLNSSYATIKMVMHQLYDGLHEVLVKLLRNAETKEAVLQYLGDVIQKNANRSQLQVSVLFHLQCTFSCELMALQAC